jgi:hypothetical protein
MTSLRPFPFLFAFLAAATALAQTDTAALQKRAADAAAAVQHALQKCRTALAAARTAIGDPENKVQGDCTTIEDVLKGETFDAGLGAIPIAIDHLEYVAEENRAATKQALESLRLELVTGSRLLRVHEALVELAARAGFLAEAGADDDTTGALTDLAASLQKATLSQALPRAELATLQQQVAQARARIDGRLAKDLLAQAKAELAQLQQDFAGMRAEMGRADPAECDLAIARFDMAARSIATALARVPLADRKAPAAELAKLQATADAAHTTAFAAATTRRIRENWLFTAYVFDDWGDEASTITGQGYVDFDPVGVETLCAPKTAAVVARSNVWFAFAGPDPDYARNRTAPEVAAFTQSIVDLQRAAHAKLLPLARTVTEGLATIEIAEERIRGRLQTFADWDLPLVLQNHADQHALVDRLHTVLDAHDRKLLGDGPALTLRREQALTAADSLWPRFQQWLPIQSGFEPVLAELFVGKLMRLEGVWLRNDEFEAEGRDLVFDLGGRVFVANLTPALRDAVRAARTRLELPNPERLGGDEPCELLAWIEGETEVRLLGPKGKDDALAVPARVVRVIGLRQGAVFAVRP